jgi:two-component system NarL family sensor kinase
LGNASLLEVYVPVSVTRSTWSTAAVVLPLTLVGLLLLALLLIPIGVLRASQLDRGRAEQRAALAYGLAAAELTRRELARDLHDDVLPRLASARLLLDAARHGPAGDTDLVGRAHQLIALDVERIRALLAGLTTAEPLTDDLPGTFAALADRFAD